MAAVSITAPLMPILHQITTILPKVTLIHIKIVLNILFLTQGIINLLTTMHWTIKLLFLHALNGPHLSGEV